MSDNQLLKNRLFANLSNTQVQIVFATLLINALFSIASGFELNPEVSDKTSISNEEAGLEVFSPAPHYENPARNWDIASAYEGVLNSYYDEFTTLVYNGSNGITDWSTSPWVEVGDGSLDPLTGAVAVRNSTMAFGGSGNTLKTGLGHANSAPGVYVYRQADLSSATSATLSFYLRHTLAGADDISLEISSNGGSSWTVLKNYTSGNPDPSNESFDISAYLAANTQIRFYINTISFGGDIWTDNVKIEYSTGSGPATFTSRVNSSSDDAEENVTSGSMDLISSDLELISDSGTDQVVGMRFNNITVPPGAIITNAYIEFEVDELDAGPTDLTIIGHDTINSITFDTLGFDISKRTQTTSTVSWNNIPAWDTESAKKQTPDIRTIIQEIIDLPGWTSGNSLSIIIEGSGERTAESFTGEPANAPLLSITYTTIDNPDLIVTTANDVLDGDTTCIASLIANPGLDNEISLREAIIAANNSPNTWVPDTIKFSIGTGPQTIMVNGTSGKYANGTGFDYIMDPVIIDATTQPGYTGTPLITLDGTNAMSTSGGLILRTNNSVIRGFIAINFIDEGLEIDGTYEYGNNNILEYNWVGIDASGNAAGNLDNGILVTSNSDSNIVRYNIVGSNSSNGIVVRNTGSDHNWVYGNIVGLAPDTLAIRANGGDGIHLLGDAAYNIIGTDGNGVNDAAEANIISGNTLNGIAILTTAGAAGLNPILGNRIYNNTLLGIDLDSAGVAPNDAGDIDPGANNLLNYIVFNQLMLIAGDINYDFNADLPAGNYRIEFFNNPSGVDPSGYGEGEVFIGSVQISHGGTGSENFIGTLTPQSAVSFSDDITAVTVECTDGTCTSFKSSSEFSAAEVVYIPEICNNSIDDDGDGLTDCSDPDCFPPAVSASSNGPICAGENLQLFETGGEATSWSWTGPNSFSSSLQNPVITGATTAASGNYFVQVQKDGSCVASTSVSVTVHALPAVSLTLPDSDECVDNTTLALSGGSPGGGSYSGTGVSGTNFNASLAGTGIHTITYTYTDVNGCVNSATDDITVHALPTVNLTLPDTDECVNNTLLTLSGGSPGGGIFSGTGVTGTNFDASTAGVGVHTITYTYTDANGCTDSATDDITVHALTAVSLTLPDTEECANSTTLALSGGSPVGGSFSGTGVSGTNFDASIAGAGIHTITYTYTDGNGCVNTATDDITVHALPTAIAGSNSPACEGADLYLTESGGDAVSWSWTGPNSFSSSDQNPTITPTSSSDAGVYQVIITDVNGCTDTSSVSVSIVAPPAAIASYNSPLCIGDTLKLFETGGEGVSWSWIGPNSFSSTDQNPVIPNATATEAGLYFVTVSNAAGCLSAVGTNVIIDTLPVVTFNLVDSVACVDETSLTLSGGSPSGGSFSGTGVTGNNFDASVAGVGMHAITYTYTDGNSCSASAIDSIEVLPLPVVSLTLVEDQTCANATILTLDGGSPAGGTYSGTGVSGGNFNATAAGPGVHTITYTYTDANGCTNFATDDVTVENLPFVILTLPDDKECVTSTTLTLSGGSPSGGSYSGPGVTGTNFDASSVGSGVHTISYTYTDANGCTNTGTDNIVVFALPNVNLTLADTEDCVLNSTLALSGGSPSGGTFSGPGVSGSNFNASAAGLGVHTITYTYTDGNGCVNTDTDDITVISPPTVSLTLDNTDACVTSTSLVLSGGNPSGGAYSGPGVTGTNFDASTAGPGDHTIIYTYTDANGCDNSDSDIITVYPEPSISSVTPTDPSSCGASDGSITVNASGGTGSFEYRLNSGPWQSSNTFSGLSAGNYNVYVRNDNGLCEVAYTSNAVVLSDPSSPTAEINLPPPGCVGVTSDFVATDAGALATYNWSFGPGSSPATATGIGPHSVSFSSSGSKNINLTVDLLGCVSGDSKSFMVYDVPVVDLTLPDTEECVSSTTLGLSGGSPSGGTFSGTGVSGTNFDASIAGAGVHTITYTYTDATGCVNSATDDITVLALPVVTLTLATNEDCVSSTTLALSGGSPSGGTYSGTGVSGTNFDPSTAGAGIHTITYTYTDANGCINSATDDITVYDFPAIDLVNTSDPTTCSGNDGSITINVSGGSGSYEYKLDSGSWQAGNSFTGLSAGSYNVFVRNDNGFCELAYASNPVVLSDPPATIVSTAVISDYTGEDISCVGESDGFATASGSGGTGPYTYLWSNGQTGDTLKNVTAGTYNVTATDAIGCQGTGSITLNDPPPLGVSAVYTHVSCFDGDDGSIDVTAIGGVGAYTYSWNDLGTIAFYPFDGSTDDVSGNDHHATSLTGTEAYSSDAVNGQQSFDFDGSTKIRYDDGTFLDERFRFRTVIMWIKPDILSGIQTLYEEGGLTDGIGLRLNGDKLRASVRKGGVEKTAYEMTFPNDGQWHQVGFVYLNGRFTLMIDGVLGATVNTHLREIRVDLDVDSQGGLGGSFSGDAWGNTLNSNFYSGLMDDVSIHNIALDSEQIANNYTNDGDRTGLEAGDYLVYVYDLNGCSDSIQLTITQPDSLALTANISDVLCNGGSTGAIDLIIAGGTGPFTQLWSTGATSEDISGLPIGTYSVTVTDDNGCTVVDEFDVNEPAVLTASTAVTSNYNGYDISCFGASDGNASVTPAGGTSPYTYIWSNTQTGANLTNVPSGAYTVTVTDDNGCTTTANVTILDPPQITVSASVTSSYNGQHISCVGATDGTATAVASNGVGSYSYAWSNGQTGATLMNVGAGTYTVTATDNNGCIATANVTLNDPPAIAITTTVTSNYNGANVSCPGSTNGTANAAASGGIGTFTYSWSNGQNGPNLVNVGAGTYTVTATDAYGCSSTETVTIVNPSVVGTTINKTSNYNGYGLSCKGASDGNATAVGSGGVGGYTYSWSNGQNGANLVNVPAGTYTVTTTDANGCTATKTVQFTNPPALNVSVSSAPPSDCGVNDGIILISASGGVGTYEYSLGGVTYQASNSFTGLAPGTYFVYVRNTYGTCIKGPIAVTVNPPEAPTIDNITIINPTTGVSTDGGILVTASGNGLMIEYSLNGGAWQSSNLFNNLSVGTYTIRIKYNGLNCISSTTATLVEGGGIVSQGGGTNYCSDDLSGVSFLETYYIPFPEDQVFTSLTSIYPGNATCGAGTDVSDPIISYNSIGVVENGTIIYFDHWEDGYEINAGFPVQSTTEIWGDGDLSNGVAPGFPSDILTAGNILVLQDNVTSTTRASVVDFDGGDKVSSRGNLAFTRLVWPTGPGTLFAGAIEVYPSLLWGSTFEIPVGENGNVNDMFDYVGAVVMASEDGTVLTIDTDGNGSTDITTTINEGQSYLIDGNLNYGASINASENVQVHLITGSYCEDYETRWFTLKSTDVWSDSYFNPVATQNGGGGDNDPTYVHLYNPNSIPITVKWNTTSGSQPDINIAAGGTAWREIADNTGSHFYTTNSMNFYAVATIDSDVDELIHDWGFAILPESQLSGQITMVGFAPGETPGSSSGSNTSPVWITPGYPSGSTSSGSITICIDYNGDGGSLTDLNGTEYDQSLVLNELALAKLYDPDGDQTGMRVWVCDGSDALIAGAWGQDPAASDGPGSSNEMDLGTGLPNGIPFAATKCANLSKDYNSNGLYDECDEVIYTLEIRNSGSLPLSTGSLNIFDSLPAELTYIENTTQSIFKGGITGLPDDNSPSSPFPLDETGYVFNTILLPGDSIIFRFEAVINDIPGAMFITNIAKVSNGLRELNPEVSFPAQEPVGLIITGIPADETVSCDNIPDPPIIGSDIYATNNCSAMDTIPQSLWTLQYVDSEDVTSGELAVNAFDGDPNTIWRTQWNGGNPPHPHEIQIDLGATYNIAGFRYLPRQTGTEGMIEDFQFYVSADGIDWGTAVTSGDWASGTGEKEEVFNIKRGRFVRLVAISEVNGNPWTSIAELNVLQCTGFSSGTIEFTETTTQTNNGSATDNCYVITRTWTGSDYCDQESVYTQNITVEDNVDPVLFNVPADITVTNAAIPEPHTISCSGLSNLALGKPAMQSSTSGGNSASNAVDGDFSNSSLSETNSEFQPWWQVDLGVVHPIEEIEIWNRTDCCTARLNNYYVLVSDYAFASTDLSTTLLDPNVSAFFQSTEAGTPSTITIDTTARYIRVQLQGTDILNLVEVVVTPSCISATDNCDPDVEITFTEINVPAGCNYDITRTWTATDNCGNTSSQTQIIHVFSILQIDAVQTSDYNGEDVSCALSSDGTADGIVTGGVAPYTINWSNGQSGVNATNLSAGTYTVTVTDDNGCSAVDNVTLVAPQDILLNTAITSNYNGEDISCTGASDGSAFANATGGTGTKTYSWSNGQNSASATGLSAGTYYVTATDANGCSKIDSVTLQDPAPLTVAATVSSNYNGEDISCVGASDGSAVATPGGGTGAITYYWSNSQSGATISGLLAGTYYVTATDVNGCMAVDSVTLNDPPPISVTAIGTDPTSCGGSDGFIDAAGSGGTGNYEYRLGTLGLWQTDTLFNGLSSGTYDVYIRNNDGSCPTGPTSVTLEDPLPQSCPIIPDQDTLTYCSTDVLIGFYVEPSPDATGYTWTVPAGMTIVLGQGTDSIVVNMNNVPADEYDICVVTNSLCGDSPPCCITLDIITCPEVCGSGMDVDGDGLVDCDDPDCQTGSTSVSTVNPSDCQANDGSITLTFSGGINPFSYTWTNGIESGSGVTGIIPNLPGGLYSIIVQDALCYLDTLAVNLLYNESNCPTSSSVCFQEAANYGILALEGGTMTINSATNIFGDVGYSENVTSTINQKAGDSGPFIGTAYVHTNVTSFAYNAGNYLPSGGVIQNNAAEDTRLNQANSDAVLFSNYFANRVPDVVLGVLGDNDDRTVNRVDSITVVEITSLNYNNDKLTLVGGAGLDDAFVINVLGDFDFSASMIELVDVRPERVLFNFPNASNISLNKSTSVFNGTILAPIGSIEYHNAAIFNGAIIARNINLHSSFNLFHKSLDIYCPLGVCRTATTNPHIMYYRRGN